MIFLDNIISLIKSIQIAKKRAKHFAINCEYDESFLSSPIATCVCNYGWFLKDALQDRYYSSALIFIAKMAEKINSHIDNNYIENDLPTRYWLSQYLNYCDSVANLDCINTSN